MDTAAIIKYFGFNEHPFMSSPDPRFLYFSSQVKEVAGHHGDLFAESEEAYKTLYTYTKGLPRDAIKVCFELLIDLAAQGKTQATANQIEEIAKGQNLRM